MSWVVLIREADGDNEYRGWEGNQRMQSELWFGGLGGRRYLYIYAIDLQALTRPREAASSHSRVLFDQAASC